MAVERERAVLVGVQLPGVDAVEHAASMAELARLVDTLGYTVVGQITQRRDGLAAAAVLGEGKLAELAAWTGGGGTVTHGPQRVVNKARSKWEAAAAEVEGEGEAEVEGNVDAGPAVDGGGASPTGRKADLVVVDHDLSPSQARNLGKATGVEVLDRTGVIVEIFHRHARSKEARLQVELARLAYVAPRLREAAGPSEHQSGRGSGESALELDRRRIRDRMAEIRHELAAIQRDQGTRRSGREGTPTVALVGYTNAGKSSLMRRLTGSEVLVADQLFATLDTTVRSLHPESHPRILVSDTVGFIQKLPHDLVASFRSTLDEARNAALLLYVVDASDPTFRHEYAVTREVLREIEADQAPSLLLLNKIDRVDEAQREALRAEFPEAIQLSALAPEDVAALRLTIIEHVAKDMTEAELFVPYKNHGVIAALHEHAQVLRETHEDEGTRIVVRAPGELLERLRGQLAGG